MQRHLLEFGRSILLQATPKTCPFSGRPYVEDMKIQGVKILLNGDWQSSLDRSTPRQLSTQLNDCLSMYYLNKSNAQKFVSLWLVICTCNFQPNSDHYFYIHQILLLKLKQNIWRLFWYFKKLLNILLFSVTMCCSKFVAIFTWPTYYIKIISRQFIHSPMMTMEDGMPMAVPDWASKLWQL